MVCLHFNPIHFAKLITVRPIYTGVGKMLLRLTSKQEVIGALNLAFG